MTTSLNKWGVCLAAARRSRKPLSSTQPRRLRRQIAASITRNLSQIINKTSHINIPGLRHGFVAQVAS